MSKWYAEKQESSNVCKSTNIGCDDIRHGSETKKTNLLTYVKKYTVFFLDYIHPVVVLSTYT